MIQRIQTIYLAIVAILSSVSLFSVIARFTNGADTVAEFTNFSFSTLKEPFTAMTSTGPWALGCILILVILLTIATIFMFNHRMHQLRLTIFNTILLVGYVAVYGFFSWLYLNKLAVVDAKADVEFQLSAMAIFPVISIILNIMAIHNIRKDERLVRSLDRIR